MLPIRHVVKKEIHLSKIKSLVLLGDVGCTGFSRKSDKVFDTILRLNTDLFFILGDLTRYGRSEEFTQLEDFAGKRTDKPIFSLCGNHDNPGYAIHLGRSSYSLILDRTVILTLDNSDMHFKEAELLFLRKQLEKHKEKRFIILFHIPPLYGFSDSSISEDEWNRLRGIMDKHNKKIQCLICAHLHGAYEYYLDGYHVYLTAGGGAEMIYDLPKGGQKIHNALKLSIDDTGSADIDMLPIYT